MANDRGGQVQLIFAGHNRTIIENSDGTYSVFCSCGWRDGTAYKERMSAAMAFSMLHSFVTEEES